MAQAPIAAGPLEASVGRLRDRLDRVRNFPANTCAASRHAQMLGETLADGAPLTEDCEHCGESILATVAALYETRTERDKLRALMAALLVQLGEDDTGDGNAPGHAHDVPGVWDSDNGELAGKPCAWCAMWAEAKAMNLTPNAIGQRRRHGVRWTAGLERTAKRRKK